MCPECLQKQSIDEARKLQKVVDEATEQARAGGYARVYIIRTANGLYGYRFPGDDSLTRLETVDVRIIT